MARVALVVTVRRVPWPGICVPQLRHATVGRSPIESDVPAEMNGHPQ